MRNSGWYIPFWRKPKRGQNEGAQAEKGEKRRRPRTRSDAELERVRADWVSRYTRQVQALRLLGLSVGAPADEITARYDELRRMQWGLPDREERLRALAEAYEVLRRE